MHGHVEEAHHRSPAPPFRLTQRQCLGQWRPVEASGSCSVEHASHDWTALAVHVERGPGVTEEGGWDAGEERALGGDCVHGHILLLVEVAENYVWSGGRP